MINRIDSPAASLHLSLRQLEIFRAVAESGSIRSAARHVHLTQPAVTHAVRELERQVGAPLFARSVKGVVPTELGLALLRRSRLLFNEVRRTQDEIVQMRDGTGGRLTVAFSSTATQLLPEALTEFRALRPGVSLELAELSWPNTDERWHGGGYDFAVVSEPVGMEPPGDDGMVREVLLDWPLVVVARRGNPLAQARSLRSLQDALWLVPGYGLPLLHDLFAARRLAAPTDVIACQSTLMALTLLQRTDALALMARNVFDGSDPAFGGVVALPLPAPLAVLHVTLLQRQAQPMTPAAQLFADCLRRAAAQGRKGSRGKAS